MPDNATWLDLTRAGLVLVLAVGQPLMGYWPQLRGWSHTTPSRSAALRTPAVPVVWAFAIWGLIFLGCIAFAVWHALPGNLADPLLRTVGWIAVLAFALTIAWEWVAPKHGLGWGTVALIVAELAVLLTWARFVLAEGPRSTLSHWAVEAPLLLWAGWISAATFVNLSSTLKGEGIRPFALGEASLATVLVASAATVGAVVAWLTGSWIYAAAVAWALFGIAISNRRTGSATVRGVAIAGIAVVLALGIASPNHPWLPV